jgi:hypothetical protein
MNRSGMGLVIMFTTKIAIVGFVGGMLHISGESPTDCWGFAEATRTVDTRLGNRSYLQLFLEHLPLTKDK